MAIKHKKLFLYLALACFAGILAIFVVDGYIGVYDSLYITSGEREERIEYEFWMQGNYPWYTYISQEGKIAFRYVVENRRLSTYSANLEVSVWRTQEKVLDVLSQEKKIAPFGQGELSWEIDTAQLRDGETSPDQTRQYSVVISYGKLERRVILDLGTLGPMKVPEAPSPVR